jgi:DivIVA domain-containing protein
VSTADVELFGPPDADGTYPRFTTVLRGYDPEQVRDYVLRLAARVDELEQELEEARSERDSARKRFGTARDDAYNQLGLRMADVLRTADRQAEKIRQDADEEVKQRVSQSKQLAQQIEREAEERAEQLRADAEELRQRTVAEREQLLGGLVASRDIALADLGAAKDHMAGIVDQLEVAMQVVRSARIGEVQAEVTSTSPEDADSRAEPHPAPEAEDILNHTEGFEIMLPEFLLREPGDGDL